MNLDNDSKLQQWFDLAELSPRTRIVYKIYVKIFCEVADKTPDELIGEAISEVRLGLLLSESRTVSYFAVFKKCLVERDYAPKTFALAISTIRSFYTAYDIPLSSIIGKTRKAKPLKENLVFLAKKDIKRLVRCARSKRNRAIILFMATSGMARQEVLNLKMKCRVSATPAPLGGAVNVPAIELRGMVSPM